MRKHHKKTFTFVELIIIIIIVLILAGISVRPLIRFFKLWQFVNQRMEIVWGSRSAIQDMATNIRMIRDEDDIYAASPTHFEFDIEDENSNIIRVDYEFSDGDLYKNDSVFMDGVSAGSFTYYDENGNTTSITEDIRSIEVDLTLTSGNETFSSQIGIKGRNLN